MVLLYYKMTMLNDELRKVEFPVGFFERLNKQVQNLSYEETSEGDCTSDGCKMALFPQIHCIFVDCHQGIPLCIVLLSADIIP